MTGGGDDSLRARWMERQGLAAPIEGSVADLLRRTGWIPLAGGQCAYLAVRARRPDLHRSALDVATIVERSVVEVPAVRGVTMLVPAEDVPLALHAGRRFEDARWAKLRKACRVTDAAIDRLGEAVIVALAWARNGLSSRELHAAIPARFVQRLGEAGKKLGDATTLPVALRRLVVKGEMSGVQIAGRIDDQEYFWTLPDPGPVASVREEDVDAELAARFFAWAGPSTRGELAAWAGIGQAAAKAAMARLHLVPAPGPGNRWMRAEDGDPPARTPRAGPTAHFLPFRDNYAYFRKKLAGPEVSTQHLLVIDGAIAGAWDWDPGASEVVWSTRDELTPAQASAARAQAEALASFVRDELGDVRVYALDNEKNRAKRLAAIREISRRARPKIAG